MSSEPMKSACDGCEARAGDGALLVKCAVEGGVQGGDHIVAEVAAQSPLVPACIVARIFLQRCAKLYCATI